MKAVLLFGILVLPCTLSGAYQYYYSDNFTAINSGNWSLNGSLTATSSGLTAPGSAAGSLISKIAVPDGTSQYEIKATLNLPNSGGSYYLMIHASSDAMDAPWIPGPIMPSSCSHPRSMAIAVRLG